MAYLYRNLACPRCRKEYGIQIVNVMLIELVTGLGPPLLRCVSCNTIFDSGSTEWFRMSDSQKRRYVFLSILYAAIESMILAWLPLIAIGMILNPVNPKGDLPTPLMWFVFFVSSLPVLGFQLLRIILSNKRFRSNIRKPVDAKYWNWEINPQGCWLALSIFIIAISYFIGRSVGVI